MRLCECVCDCTSVFMTEITDVDNDVVIAARGITTAPHKVCTGYPDEWVNVCV